ncbi:superkiller complex helicase subunit twister [Arctopsyche grandis]|uniref:superkiller complex helicase subunit twister n=1 Tax=Arctopsyche grandis TaxID=121162 RepID=UPI00406D920E
MTIKIVDFEDTSLQTPTWLDDEDLPPVAIDELQDSVVNLLIPAKLSNYEEKKTTKIWQRKVDLKTLFVHQNVLVHYSLKSVKHPQNDEIIGWTEKVDIENGKTDDLSMKRPPLPPQLASRGNPARIPFLPSNFAVEKVERITEAHANEKSFMGQRWLSRIAKLNIGLDFIEETEYSEPMFDDNLNIANSKTNRPQLNLRSGSNRNSLSLDEDPLIGMWGESDGKSQLQAAVVDEKDNSYILDKKALEDEIMVDLPKAPVLSISTHKPVVKSTVTEWVEIMDTSRPVEDFEKKVPNMAHKFPFELDTFQKLAILKLEEQAHVFVAAHTSAGKTVVAEYAIALSLKHCTRVVYTSPVKALSNQKYREFTRAFGDVGLITGDIQINTTASCLVMTTEILRSMLYYGADVIRDLEYVIFDEVHYINDTQRGYVWEEVLILLPSHCGIVMLSATVPNTLEFADWVGRTKKRMVYVVSTTKRPVGLCHYLYTGSGGKSKDNRYKIMGPEERFLLTGYTEACKSYLSKKAETFGPKNKFAKGNFRSPNQEKGMWVGLVDHLQRNDKLPVVVFILSRNRCDGVAESLTSLDLTTAKEKSRTHIFIQACLRKLSESDRKLPQVMTLQSLLSQGIGVHHSGILPILKEVVEMLFQLGLVKLLFATETFAVGVNMPARTVIFESITKYDGMNWRTLLPSEYIQMAGRAGRRGLDDTGTVIILCKKEVPASSDLVNMILGKPTKLSSQFRVTYATMLSLLRVTNLSIESMMKNSFREFGVQSKTSTVKIEMQNLSKLLSELERTPNYAFLSQFCEVASQYIQELTDIMPVILMQKTKEILPGKILVVCFEKYAFQLGVLLGYTGNRFEDFKVLVLEFDPNFYMVSPHITNKNLWYAIKSLARTQVYSSAYSNYPNHKVITIKSKHIVALTSAKYKGDCSAVLNDYDTRQHSKTKNTPPSPKCLQAVRELVQLSFTTNIGTTKIEFVNLTKGLKINRGEIMESLNRVAVLEKQLGWMGTPSNHFNFENEFPAVFERKQIEWKYNEMERMLSTEGMSLYPEYQKKLQVLKELRYIDSQQHVAIKGRVACELGKNELMITEIVFRNILTDLGPAEIAALLSCLVVEARIQLKTQQKLDKKLEDRIIEIQYVDQYLSELEKQFDVGTDDPLAQADRLNFGLVQVVYEWAKGKPFCEIINITDVQEGIIVHSIQKLHEVLMNVRDVAKIIGDPILQSKMDEASLAIKRDIVFAASLYTQDDVNLNF